MNLSDALTLLTRSFEYLWTVRVSIVLAIGLVILIIGNGRERRWGRVFAALVGAWLTIFYLPSVLVYFAGLSSDSFGELKAPKPTEARFFLSTITSLIQPEPLRRAAVSVVAISAFLTVVLWLTRSILWTSTLRLRRLGLAWCAVLCMAVALNLANDIRISSAEIAQVRVNYSGPVPTVVGAARNLHVLVYIGESTTVMDWHMYGYHRQTTPRLDERRKADEGLLVYNLAMSTHTHTSPSLMDVLGIPLPPGSATPPVQIYDRHYASIVDALKSGGVNTSLVTNQSLNGSWNAGAIAAFGHVDLTISAFDSHALGNNDLPKSLRIDDQQLFERDLPKVWKAGTRQAVFLHSYAGHGPYLENIPAAFRQPVDASLTGRDSHGVIGDSISQPDDALRLVDEYDSAMKYVDFSVDSVMAFAARNPEPTVVIYFSDHGESAWTNRSHDSSRFIHEMLRVPLLMYFNQTARAAYPALFAQYRDEASQDRPRFLSSISGTLLDLFGLTVSPGPRSLLSDQRPAASAGVVVRGLGDRLTAKYPVGEPASRSPSTLPEDDSDLATRMFRLTNGRAEPPLGEPEFCYHRADALARARRAALVADCVEFDIAVPDGKTALEVFHPPVAATGYTLAEAFAVLEGSGKGLWIDSKDIGSASHCLQLATQLENWKRRPKNILVEFSADFPRQDPMTATCMSRLHAVGARTSFYVPTARANACSASLHNRKSDNVDCVELNKVLQAAIDSKLFTDLSFDIAGQDAVARAPQASTLRWNTWGVPIESASATRFKGFGMVIVDSELDPNLR